MHSLTTLLDIKYPIIMAPMFLVSNAEMVKAALDAGITGAIPALNYRSVEELEAAIKEIKAHSFKPFGINLIANKSNIKLHEQLRVCLEQQVAFIITSLGNPKDIISQAHQVDTKVFCDVVDVHYAKKVVAFGADAVIAVNNEAGGHAGPNSLEELYNQLSNEIDVPIIAAGRLSTKTRLDNALAMGYAGASIGTIFIPTVECPVSIDYKNACISYGAKDIVMTTKLSGTPCTVINTPYVQEVGTKQNAVERFLNRYKGLKKYMKMFVMLRGMKNLEKAAFTTTYKTVWCAGVSIEDVQAIKPMQEVVKDLTEG